MIRKLFSFATMLLLLASCANDIDNSSRLQMRTGTDNKLPVFYATIEGSDDAATKVFADEQLRVLWNADDRITVFNKHSYGYEYSFTGEDGDNAGEFTAVLDNGNVNGNALAHVYALYPHNATTEISNDGIITATLPAKQTYKADSFGIGANTMVSVTDDTQLRFKNVGGYLSFKFYGDNVSVTRITLRGNNHEKIAGNASISMTVGGTPTVEMREDATESITLMCDTPVRVGSTADNPTEFWFVLPPTDFTNGITVTVVDDKGGFFQVNSSTRLIFERNKLSRLAAREIVPAAMIPPDNEIWYTTTNNAICDYESWSIWSDTMPFNSNVISHTYEDGKGIIRCDGPITAINDYAFWNDIFSCINGLFLPNSVSSLGVSSLSGTRITELRLPDNLTSINMYSLSVPTLARLYGNNISEDGRCVIYNHYYTQIDFGDSDHPEGIFDYVDGYVVAFAPGGPSSYSLPSEATILGWYAFAGCHLENITFNEGLKKILGDCFLGARLECVLELPSTLEELNAYAFNGCTGIKGICGNEKFHTADNRCLIYQQKNYDPASGANGTWIGRFFGPDVTDYSIPEGIVGIENYAFDGASNLKTVTFPHSMKEVGAYAFYNCKSLKEVYGDCASTDHKGIVFGSQFRRLAVTNNVTHYTVPDGITSIGYSAFERCGELEEIILPDSVTELGGYDFAFCDNLKKVVLSSSLERINSYNPFLGAWNLEEIYFRSFIPPQYSDDQFYEWDRTKLKIYVPEETLIWYKTARQWSDFAPYMVGYKYDDIGEWAPDHYISLDYSANGEVTMLQTASKGNGIHVILMGDAFSDRQIADGSYARAMQRAKEALFSQEPYKSMKDYFNVYSVGVVSKTEGYEYNERALSTELGDELTGDDNAVIGYALKAVTEEQLDEALIIVLMNHESYASNSYLYYPDSGDYGNGMAISFFTLCSDDDAFNRLVTHEAGGHGFAKLADEFVYEGNEAITNDNIEWQSIWMAHGWWKNVDFTSDPEQVKWAHFISDPRYAGENIGCYEGAFTFPYGVWRPTQNSLMRDNTGGFNAPSREAIWYRIHKLAYGENWQYNYEDFVAYDAVNRTAAASYQAPRPDYVTRQLPKPTPPVVVGHSWREALKLR